jgi:hypothetical protein
MIMIRKIPCWPPGIVLNERPTRPGGIGRTVPDLCVGDGAHNIVITSGMEFPCGMGVHRSQISRCSGRERIQK